MTTASHSSSDKGGMAIGHFLQKQDLFQKKFGAQGEGLAAQYLKNHGYTILSKNYRTRLGEIDLIVQKDGVIHFVEVKNRHRGDLVGLNELIPYSKQKKISKVAQEYVAKLAKSSKSKGEVDAVFSALLIDWSDAESPQIEWIENAFDLSYGY